MKKKRVVDIPRPNTWDGWLTEWNKRTHLADLQILLENGFVYAHAANRVQEYTGFLLQLAEGNSVGIHNSVSPMVLLANKAFEILDKILFNTTYGVELLFFKPEVMTEILRFFMPANGKTKLIGLQNIFTDQETRVARQFAEDISLFILNGLNDQMKKQGNPKTVEIILKNRVWAVRVLHALGRLNRLMPSKSTDWDKFDDEVMAALKKLARKDLSDEAADLKGEEMIEFARSIGSQAAILYLMVRAHQEYTSKH